MTDADVDGGQRRLVVRAAHRFADHNDKGIDLLQRVTRVSVETQAITPQCVLRR